MEIVLIDTFRIPHEAMQPFFERAGQAQAFIKTLPGFVEGYVYEQRDAGEAEQQLVTVAVWADEQAFEQAKQAVAAHNQQQGIDVQAFCTQLGITFNRAVFTRSPY